MQEINKITEDNIEKLKIFEKEFLEYNSHTNLISKNDENCFWQKHIKDSLSFELFYQKYMQKNQEAKLLDIGTGGGLPALPISLCYPQIKVFAIDSVQKKIKFINDFKEKYKIDNIEGISKRIEELPIDFRSSFDVITSRALAKLNILLEYAIPFLKVGGYFVAYKSKLAQEEIKEAQNALTVLNAKIVEIIEYSKNDCERNLIIIQKTSDCSSKYPRQNGLVKKNPL